MKTVVVIPAYNEATALPALLAALGREVPDATACVVDDGSSDATADVAARSGAVVLRLPVNLGIGGAVQAGYLLARDRSADAAVQLDGDGQHDPAEIEALLGPLRRGEADLVVGSRFLAPGGFRSTAARRVGIRYLSWFLRLRCGVRVTDPTSGFRAANRAAIQLFARAYPSDYPEPESIAVAHRAGLRVVEVPVRMRERAHGTLLDHRAPLPLLPGQGVAGPGLPPGPGPDRPLPRGVAMNAPSFLPLELQLLSLAVLVSFLAWVIELIRTQRLSVRDSLAWLLTTLAAIAVTAFPALMAAAAELVGIHVPSNAVFGAGLLYLGVNVLAITIAGSSTAATTRRLAQECALLRAEVARLGALAERQAGPPAA